MDVDDLPVLGEPLCVELANTRYGEGQDFIDFLETSALAELWLTAVDGLDACRLSASDHAALLRLRDASFDLCEALAHGLRPAEGALRVIGATAALGAPTRTLAWDPAPRWVSRRKGSAATRLLGALASEIGDWVCTEQRGQVRRCPGPGCTMFFVKVHHRRRFCHESCSHRARQAAYYRRQRAES